MKCVFGSIAVLLSLSMVQCRPQNTLVVSSTTIPPPVKQEIAEDEAPPAPSEPVTPTISSFSVRSDIQYRYAHTVVETYFKNPDIKANQVTFSLVLPDKAFIANFSMLLGGEEFVARVETKEDAKEAFNSAVSSGQAAGIVEQDARDANQIVVSANVEAGGKARFRLTYEELLQRKLERYEHVVYVNPGQIVKDFRIDVYINESLPVSHVFVPELKEDPNAITSFKENREAVVDKDPEDDSKVHITYKPSVQLQQELSDETGVSGQFIVQYDVDRKNQSSDIQVIDGYFVHFFAPDELETLPKHIVFVLDVSGSMHGEKLLQTKDAMVTIIDDLTEQDSFNILTFSDEVYHWVPKEEKLKDGPHLLTYSGTKDMRNEALKYVLDLRTIGGTNINDGILDAIKKVEEVQRSETLSANTKPIIIFLTDGQATSGVTNKEQIKNNVAKANKQLELPIYSLAFGRGADFSLVKEISKENNAFARKIYEGSDAAIQLEDFYLEIASPLLTGLNIQYTGEYVNASTITNAQIGSFNKGNEIVIAGKLNDVQDGGPELLDVMIGGNDKQGDYMRNFRICLPRPVPLPMPIELRTDDDVSTAQLETDELPSQMKPIDDIILPPFWPDRCIPLPPRPVEPKSDAQNFVERLWAFLTIKELLDGKDSAVEEKKQELEDKEEEEDIPKIDATTEEGGEKVPEEFQEFPKTPEMTNKEKALELALRYNFVTELTSLVVVRPNATEEDEKEILEPVPVALNNGARGSCPGCHSMNRISSPHLMMAQPQQSFGGFSSGAFGGTSLRSSPASAPRRPQSRPPPMRKQGGGASGPSGKFTTTTTHSPTTTNRLASAPQASAYDYYDTDEEDDDVFNFASGFEDASEQEAFTPPPPKTSCNGSISLHDQTYLRGKNVTLTDSDLDLSGVSDIDNSLTSLEVRGDCCWKIFTEPNNAGDSKVFRVGEFKSASQMGSVFRAASSVEILFEC